MKNRWHTLRHWEYWPVQIVYFFTGLYWIFWAIRLRSISFYKYANPAIPNGGLFGDSKFGIYSILPNECCPQTILVSIHQSVDLERILMKFPNGFPLVLKPDVGCRGIGVQKVDDMEQWRAYHIKSKQDYLVQQWIAWPKELSLFYCRFPNASKGKIVSLTLKEF